MQRPDVELTPPQPPAVEAAVAGLLADDEGRTPDPWWSDGLRDSLNT
jgi:hypothetical protein